MPAPRVPFFRSRAFTLVELLVSCVVISLLGMILVQITNQTAKTWKYTSSKSEEFREARTAFETMTSRISQATLNTYWDYDDATKPTRYERRSELRFISGKADAPTNLLPVSANVPGKRVTHCTFFHAPFGFVDDTKVRSVDARTHGLDGLLNVWGYFVELNDDSALRPAVLPKDNSVVPLRQRFRLMEMMVPAEKMQTYKYTSGQGGDLQPKGKTYTGKQWYQAIVNSADPDTHVLAENIVALILHPELSSQDRADMARTGSSSADTELAPDYLYDSAVRKANRLLNSKDQLPPVMRVTMVAIDETGAQRLTDLAKTGPDPAALLNLPGKFQSAASFKDDLTLDSLRAANASLENTLVGLKINYRVFTTTVPIRAAKWSQNQTDTP